MQFYIYMLYNSCMVKYSKIYWAYGVNLGEYFYLHIVHLMCGQIQQNIQGIWCEFGRVFLLIYCSFHVFIKCSKNYRSHGALML